jgi:DNA modification methylase
MPTLNWPQKTLSPLPQVKFDNNSNIYPGGDFYPSGLPENHLYLGDNLRTMAALLPDFAGRIDLIYADPPFFTNKKFSARIGRGEDSRNPSQWKLSDGYSDHWEDIDEYLGFLYPRLNLMHKLLSPTGSLYLHLDWHADSYARILLDELFGSDRLINQIAWLYHGPSPIRNAFNRKHDTIFVYSKTKDYTFNGDAVREPYNPNTIKTFASSTKAGFGKIPDLKRGKIPEDWWYFPVVARLHNERTGYPTQKPESLLERIIRASSNPGDLVADFFCGSGTTPLVAARLGRHFIGADATWRAINTTRNRLVSLPAKPFTIWRDEELKITKEKTEIEVKLTGSQISLVDPPELDYWELDPDWNGLEFNSAIQKIRPIRNGEIPLSINYPNLGEIIKINAVTIDGELIEMVIKNSDH